MILWTRERIIGIHPVIVNKFLRWTGIYERSRKSLPGRFFRLGDMRRRQPSPSPSTPDPAGVYFVGMGLRKLCEDLREVFLASHEPETEGKCCADHEAQRSQDSEFSIGRLVIHGPTMGHRSLLYNQPFVAGVIVMS